MARRIPYVNGNAPPPSTLAAQVVQNHNRPALQNGETALKHVLRQLLDSPDTAQETDLAVNVQLVHVLAEAGLAPLAQSNPLVSQADLVSEARDSIAVIERTIRRQPEVLFTPIADSAPPIGLLLLVRLASVCGKAGTEALSLANLADCAIQAASVTIELWKAAEALKSLCIDVVEGTFETAQVS
jgi:serine/threonine-protein kinase ATR